MFEEKNKPWYKGIFFICFFMLFVPIAFSLFFIYVTKLSRTENLTEGIYTAKLLGCVCGLLFDGTCIITGLFKGTFSVVINRWKEFFLDLKVSLKFAIKNYFYDLVHSGVLFWVLCLIIGITVYVGWTHYQLLMELIK